MSRFVLLFQSAALLLFFRCASIYFISLHPGCCCCLDHHHHHRSSSLVWKRYSAALFFLLLYFVFYTIFNIKITVTRKKNCQLHAAARDISCGKKVSSKTTQQRWKEGERTATAGTAVCNNFLFGVILFGCLTLNYKWLTGRPMLLHCRRSVVACFIAGFIFFLRIWRKERSQKVLDLRHQDTDNDNNNIIQFSLSLLLLYLLEIISITRHNWTAIRFDRPTDSFGAVATGNWQCWSSCFNKV